MEHHSIITQVSREEEALTCQPASEKGNTCRLRWYVDCGDRCFCLQLRLRVVPQKHGADFSLPGLVDFPIYCAEDTAFTSVWLQLTVEDQRPSDLGQTRGFRSPCSWLNSSKMRCASFEVGLLPKILSKIQSVLVCTAQHSDDLVAPS